MSKDNEIEEQNYRMYKYASSITSRQAATEFL
jgi:hypothetical protein